MHFFIIEYGEYYNKICSTYCHPYAEMESDSLSKAQSECHENPLCRKFYASEGNGAMSYYSCGKESKNIDGSGIDTLYTKKGKHV